MVTNRTPLRARRRRLSIEETDNLLVGLYPHAFRSEDERHAAWLLHRERLTIYSGQRPDAWWTFEAPKHGIAFPDEAVYESAALYEAGILTPGEVAQRMEWWKYHFDAAQEPGFTYNDGEPWLKGEAAKKAQYAWIGIPHSVVARWREANGQ